MTKIEPCIDHISLLAAVPPFFMFLLSLVSFAVFHPLVHELPRTLFPPSMRKLPRLNAKRELYRPIYFIVPINREKTI